MAPKNPDEVISLVTDALKEAGLEPRPIDRGRTDELRGGLQCLDLAGDGLDAAVLKSGGDINRLFSTEHRFSYMVDYAVRGTIRGVLPGRIVSRTVLELQGLLRKRLAGMRWEVPQEEQADTGSFVRTRAESVPPGPGELWEGGPHQTLTERLNGDDGLRDSLLSFLGRPGKDPLNLTVASDAWGESIRISGDRWLGPKDLLTTYASPSYIDIAARIGLHIKDVRRNFGGLTF